MFGFSFLGNYSEKRYSGQDFVDIKYCNIYLDSRFLRY